MLELLGRFGDDADLKVDDDAACCCMWTPSTRLTMYGRHEPVAQAQAWPVFPYQHPQVGETTHVKNN